MASITSRQGLIDHCLRKLGSPVIEINVDVDQIEDRVDDAFLTYQEFHGDATNRTYLQYLVTSADVTNKYISVPSEVIYIVNMFNLAGGNAISSNNMFSFKYQFAMSDFHAMGRIGGGLGHYAQTKAYMETLDLILNGTPQTTFSRRQNRLYLWGDIDDNDIKAGEYIMLECYTVIDPETHTSVYNDMFMRDMTTALIKQQWGQNLSKFEGMQLPGGVTINGREIREEANGEIAELRERLRSEQELPADFFIG